MSIITNIEDLPWETRQNIAKDLEIQVGQKNMIRYVYPFTIQGNNIVLPFAYGVRGIKLKRPPRDNYPPINVTFEGVPRPEQEEVLAEAKQYLNKSGSVIVSGFPGFGKTMCAINLCCFMRFRTLFIVNKIVLMQQWKESIIKFCPNAVVQILKPNSKKQDADFYIINAQNVEKMGKHYFSDIGALVIDEAHMIMAETLSRCMQYIFPRYLIGLTATPYRPDGLDILLTLYFGQNKIIRELHRRHTAYRVSTGFKPTVKYMENGRVNWGIVLDSQANDLERNELIVKLLKHFPDRNFLVLVKRISQGEHLVCRLEEEGEDVTSLLGTAQEFEVNARILIGTSGKIGVGFDHARLDALLLAADVEEYFIQYLGRVFRTKEVEPIILDLVDKNPILEKHFRTRRDIYVRHGGVVMNLELNK